MAEWRKILVSGSNAHVASITASDVPDVVDRAEVLFRQDSSGRFFSDTSIFYTASDKGQLYLDNIGLTAFNISASGTPDLVSNNSEILFRNPTTTGLESTSSLFFNTDENTLEFVGGTFSGSFTGDGSGLTGVVGTLAEPLVNGNGIASSSGADFSYDGTLRVDFLVKTASNGGIVYASNGIQVATTLAGHGLEFPHASDSNYSTMSIKLDGTSNGTSGLKTGSNGLALSDNIGGDGLDYTNGVLKIDLASQSGLTFQGSSPNKQLRLSALLDGEGLTFTNTYSELSVDPTFVVTSSNVVKFKTGSNNLTMSPGTGVTASAGGFTGHLHQNPVFTYDLNNTLSGDFTFTDDLFVEGNFTVSGTLASASFETENINIADQFILLNSGSTEGDGGFVVQTSNTQGAYIFYDYENKRWGVSDEGELLTQNSHSILTTDHAAIVTTTITENSESVVLSSTPVLGDSAGNRPGQLIITTNPLVNESSVYIYA
jgi:hypothetical protein